MNLQILQEIGLTDSEVKVYLALLKIGSSRKGPIVKEAGITSSKVYEVIDKLIEKGLASYVLKNKVKYFNAAPPSRIKDYLKQKEIKIKEQEVEIDKYLPKLWQCQVTANQTEAEVYRGWKGVETVYNNIVDLLKNGDTNYVFGASRGEDEERTKLFFDRFNKRRHDKGIKSRIIFNELARGFITSLKDKYDEVRYLEQTTPSEIDIAKDKVVILILNQSPIAIIITDAKVAQSFRSYFDIMWKIARK